MSTFANSSRRSVNKILNEAVLTVNCREISLFISSVIIILRRTAWYSTTLKAWLCFEFLISYIHVWMFSSSFAMMRKKHFICLLSSCRLTWSLISWIFRSLSQIIHALLIISSLNFLIRFNIIAYSSRSTCSLMKRTRFFKKAKLRSSEKRTRFMIESWEWRRDKNENDDEMRMWMRWEWKWKFFKVRTISSIACFDQNKRKVSYLIRLADINLIEEWCQDNRRMMSR